MRSLRKDAASIQRDRSNGDLHVEGFDDSQSKSERLLSKSTVATVDSQGLSAVDSCASSRRGSADNPTTTWHNEGKGKLSSELEACETNSPSDEKLGDDHVLRVSSPTVEPPQNRQTATSRSDLSSPKSSAEAGAEAQGAKASSSPRRRSDQVLPVASRESYEVKAKASAGRRADRVHLEVGRDSHEAKGSASPRRRSDRLDTGRDSHEAKTSASPRRRSDHLDTGRDSHEAKANASPRRRSDRFDTGRDSHEAKARESHEAKGSPSPRRRPDRVLIDDGRGSHEAVVSRRRSDQGSAGTALDSSHEAVMSRRRSDQGVPRRRSNTSTTTRRSSAEALRLTQQEARRTHFFLDRNRTSKYDTIHLRKLLFCEAREAIAQTPGPRDRLSCSFVMTKLRKCMSVQIWQTRVIHAFCEKGCEAKMRRRIIDQLYALVNVEGWCASKPLVEKTRKQFCFLLQASRGELAKLEDHYDKRIDLSDFRFTYDALINDFASCKELAEECEETLQKFNDTKYAEFENNVDLIRDGVRSATEAAASVIERRRALIESIVESIFKIGYREPWQNLELQALRTLTALSDAKRAEFKKVLGNNLEINPLVANELIAMGATAEEVPYMLALLRREHWQDCMKKAVDHFTAKCDDIARALRHKASEMEALIASTVAADAMIQLSQQRKSLLPAMQQSAQALLKKKKKKITASYFSTPVSGTKWAEELQQAADSPTSHQRRSIATANRNSITQGKRSGFDLAAYRSKKKMPSGPLMTSLPSLRASQKKRSAPLSSLWTSSEQPSEPSRSSLSFLRTSSEQPSGPSRSSLTCSKQPSLTFSQTISQPSTLRKSVVQFDSEDDSREAQLDDLITSVPDPGFSRHTSRSSTGSSFSRQTSAGSPTGSKEADQAKDKSKAYSSIESTSPRRKNQKSNTSESVKFVQLGTADILTEDSMIPGMMNTSDYNDMAKMLDSFGADDDESADGFSTKEQTLVSHRHERRKSSRKDRFDAIVKVESKPDTSLHGDQEHGELDSKPQLGACDLRTVLGLDSDEKGQRNSAVRDGHTETFSVTNRKSFGRSSPEKKPTFHSTSVKTQSGNLQGDDEEKSRHMPPVVPPVWPLQKRTPAKSVAPWARTPCTETLWWFELAMFSSGSGKKEMHSAASKVLMDTDQQRSAARNIETQERFAEVIPVNSFKLMKPAARSWAPPVASTRQALAEATKSDFDLEEEPSLMEKTFRPLIGKLPIMMRSRTRK